ncbi:LysR family transcriptional regulator [Sneathiella glossodoripedis]|uniref:LysR family transcriptional regulator n=1 Tax=Sneathiella glossodoripedis TaxID=418853 RepID=UPI000472E889|nr:LysR family transcriptional regulator [Sneathiella glossodoripedis]
MRYTLKQLRYIEVAARHRSITHASKELNISPSSISAAIDSIEQELGRAIFRRLPSKGITPTQFGAAFLGHARQLLKAHLTFEDAVTQQANTVNGSIKMGCFTPAAPILLPLITRSVANNYPGISMHFEEGENQANLTKVVHNEIDLGLGFLGEPHEGISFTPLFKAPPHVVLPHDHPLASQTVLSLKDLHTEPMVLLDLEQTRDYMFSLFAEDNLTPRVVYSSKSAEMVRSMVAAGLGYSVFNLRPLRKQQYTVGDLVRIPLTSGYRVVEFGILRRKDAALSKADQVVIETCLRLRSEGAFNDAVLAMDLT